MPGWFGPASWGAPVCVPADRVAMPEGVLCSHCLERITSRDCGFVMRTGEVLHRECLSRTLFGGVNHILEVCTCCRGILPQDNPGRTVREAAIEADAAWDHKMHNKAAAAERRAAAAARRAPEA